MLEDIQTLNGRALSGELEGAAISAGAYPQVADKYRIMRVGSSIGRNYGPMVVATAERAGLQLEGARIAIPGEYTTAYLMLRLYAQGFDALPMPFDAITGAVQGGEADAGPLIHEGQVTYESLGRAKILDLCEAWGQDTGLPIPLGLDMARRDLGEEVAELMVESLRDSIQYAFDHEDEALDYAMQFSRGTERETVRRFIRMCVNDDTLDMGDEGEKALDRGVVDSMPPIDLI